LFVVRWAQGFEGDLVLEEVEPQEPAVPLVGLVEQEALVVLEEAELALSVDLEAVVDFGKKR
jgi:hypothetical protein